MNLDVIMRLRAELAAQIEYLKGMPRTSRADLDEGTAYAEALRKAENDYFLADAYYRDATATLSAAEIAVLERQQLV